MLQSLQVFRGLAAAAVVLVHASVSTEAFVGQVPDVLMRAFQLGGYGVDFFFVLSGFIIMHAHMGKPQTRAMMKGYALKRVVRIFPAYWPIGLGVIAMYFLLPNLSASGGREFGWLTSFFLIPSELPPALPVAWTLVHELMFYAVFLLYFWGRRYFLAGLLVWLVLIVVFQDLPSASAGASRYPLSVLNIEFMFGVVAALMHQRTSSQYWVRVYLWLGMVVFISQMAALYMASPLAHRLMLAAGLALLIVSFACRDRSAPTEWPSCLLHMGNASYSIYLVHGPLLSVTQRALSHATDSWVIALLTGIALSLLGGSVYHRSIERPATAWAKQRWS